MGTCQRIPSLNGSRLRFIIAPQVQRLLKTRFLSHCHLVLRSALASSAPVNMLPGLASSDTIYATTTRNYEAISEICATNIRRFWNVVDAISSTGNYSTSVFAFSFTCWCVDIWRWHVILMFELGLVVSFHGFFFSVRTSYERIATEIWCNRCTPKTVLPSANASLINRLNGARLAEDLLCQTNELIAKSDKMNLRI